MLLEKRPTHFYTIGKNNADNIIKKNYIPVSCPFKETISSSLKRKRLQKEIHKYFEN